MKPTSFPLADTGRRTFVKQSLQAGLITLTGAAVFTSCSDGALHPPRLL